MSGYFEICQAKMEFWNMSGKTDLCQGKIRIDVCAKVSQKLMHATVKDLLP